MKKLTKIVTSLVLASLTSFSLLPNNALADEEKNISVSINKSNDQNAVVDIKVNGQASVFELPELQEGQTKTLTTESGSSVTVSKNNGQLKLLMEDGEEILLPNVDGHDLSARVKALHTIDGKGDDSIKIIANDLTDSQRQIIKDSLLAAGVDKKVKFIENSPAAFFFKGADDAVYEFDHEIEEVHIKDGQKIKIESQSGNRKKHVIIKKRKE